MTPTQKPDPLRPGMPYQINLRLPSALWRGAALIAHSRGVSIATVVREALTRELSRYASTRNGVTLLEAVEMDPELDLATDELGDLVADEDGSQDA